ncbi:MFS transporter [Novosphingobium sp. PASSN1]|uniref:MFS transporter n=1 Tax=Novosphingobium sp. PASSN1 TaxID=2015561 RepID=UPI0025DF01A9|nr:MFS transporter [Novosphingobium sp. PASSN1]
MGTERRNSPFLAPLLVSGTGLLALVFVALAPVLAQVADHFGGGTGGAFAAQMLMSTPALGIVVGGPIWGFVLRAAGPSRTLQIALIAYACAGLSGLFIDHSGLLIATRFLLGVAVAGVVTTTSYLIGQQFDGAARERLFGLQGATGAGVALVGVWCAGLLGRQGGWHAPFLIYGAALIMLAIASLVLPRLVPSSPESPLQIQDRAPSARFDFLRLAPFYMVVLMMSVVMQMTGIQTGLVLAEDGVTDPGVAAIVLGMASISGILVGLIYGRLRKSIEERTTAALILACWSAGQIAIGFSHSPWSAAAAVAVSGLGSGLMLPFLPPALLRRVPDHAHPQALGFYYSTMFVGDFLNPLVMSSIRTVVPDYHAVFIAVGAICGLAFAVVVLTHRRKLTA